MHRFWILLLPVLVLSPAAWSQSRSGPCSFCHLAECLEADRKGHEKHAVSCDACHGPSEGHRIVEDNRVKPDRTAKGPELVVLCGECHSERPTRQPSKPGRAVALYMAGAHARSGALCTTCHGVHGFLTAAEQDKACAKCHPEPPPQCRPAEGSAVRCISCHDPHSLKTPADARPKAQAPRLGGAHDGSGA